jgi:CDP-glucose 4,6-dehydratase
LEDLVATAARPPQPMKDFYAGQRVLVTGHTGFKGGWLCLWLKHFGASVAGFSLAPVGTPNLFELAQLADGVQSHIGDIRDAGRLRSVLEQIQPSLVFHLAAQPLVRLSYADPVGTFATNVMGTVHLLDAVRHVPSVRGVVVVTSDKCYDNKEWVWGYRENEAMGGADPYSCSKGCAELVTAAYRKSFAGPESGRSIASGRAGNVFGGGDWSDDRLIPDIAKAVMKGQPVIIRNPSAVRPWQHVLEPLSGYLLLGQKLLSGDPAWADAWNFGPDAGADLTVGELAETVLHRWGKGRLAIQPDPLAPHEAHLLRLDSSKARTLLKWRPVLSLGEAISWTVDWYRAFERAPKMMRKLTNSQIEQYLERLTW